MPGIMWPCLEDLSGFSCISAVIFLLRIHVNEASRGVGCRAIAMTGYIRLWKRRYLYRTNALRAISGRRGAGRRTDSHGWTGSEWIEPTRREGILLPPRGHYCRHDIHRLRLERSIWAPLWKGDGISIWMTIVGLLDS